MGDSKEKQECDIVMKGGITSGVVYPGLLCELADQYRFRSIGGTSAGAIAAAAAAAAEYGRQHDNPSAFDDLADLSDELSEDLLSLFQPQPRVAGLYDALIAGVSDHEDSSSRLIAVIGALGRAFRVSVFVGTIPAAVILLIAWMTNATVWLTVISFVLLAPIGAFAALAYRTYRAVQRDLPAAGFGLCSGVSDDEDALTEWLHERIQKLAGLDDDEPLTFGHLFGEGGRADPNIELQVMTTSLTHQVPFQIPFASRKFFYREDELRDLFPNAVVDFMTKDCRDDCNLRQLPEPEDFPVLVAVRMSLSFPGLLTPIPLLARDFSQRDEDARHEMQRVWMSDGGICSNFPIHFFDSVWPSRPTFGVNLTNYDPSVHDESRVYLPSGSRQGMTRPFRPIGDMLDFGLSIITTMQDWRDVIPTTLPGYRERIVHIALDEKEGGLNLAMPPERVEQLGVYGTEAGQTLRDDFDFASHRWRRHLVWTARLEAMLKKGLSRYEQSPAPDRDIATDETLPWHDRALAMGLSEFLEDYGPAPGTYNQSNERHDAAMGNLERLMDVARFWEPVVDYDDEGKMENIPRPPLGFRLTPDEAPPAPPADE